jgi:purine-binding chemotaxis protein CheW
MTELTIEKTEKRNTDIQDKAGKYLTFTLAQEEYGVEILKVREIIGIMDVTKIPRAPKYVRGVINLRGKVNPVIDTRLKFNMDSAEDTEETCIIIVEVTKNNQPLEMGILVDSVSEVLDIEETQIEATPEFGTGVDTQFIMGVAKAKSGIKILLDIDKVLTSEDLHNIKNINK